MVMGRRRLAQNRDLPDNLYPCKGGFYYVHPRTSKRTYWPVTRDKSINAAKKLNAILLDTSDLVGDVLGESKTIADAIKLFCEVDLPSRKWGKQTAEGYGFMLALIEKQIGKRRLTTFGTRDAAEYLKTVTNSAHSRIKYRNLLMWIFACAVEDGLVQSNPIEQTRKVKSVERKRERLTLEGFNAIREKAGEMGMPWLQNAMDLALHTLLRRADIAGMKFTDVREDGCLYVVPKKTEDSTEVHLRIAISAPIRAVLNRCRDKVLSPFVIHRLPIKGKPQGKKSKDRTHHTELLPDQITRSFKEARDACEMFKGMVNGPTLHEIRSLGGRLYEEQGWTLQQVQALMGHATEAMTAHYLESSEPRWVDVTAGLSLP